MWVPFIQTRTNTYSKRSLVVVVVAGHTRMCRCLPVISCEPPPAETISAHRHDWSVVQSSEPTQFLVSREFVPSAAMMIAGNNTISIYNICVVLINRMEPILAHIERELPLVSLSCQDETKRAKFGGQRRGFGCAVEKVKESPFAYSFNYI